VEIAHVINLSDWTPERVETLLPRVKKFFKSAGRKAMYHVETRLAVEQAMDIYLASKKGGNKSGEVRGKQGELPLDNSARGKTGKGGSNISDRGKKRDNKLTTTKARERAQGKKAESRAYEQTTLELTTADLLLLRSFPGSPSLYSEEVPKVVSRARVIAFDPGAWEQARIAELDGRKVTQRELKSLVCANYAELKKRKAA
jgi:hypothetical protein